MVRTSCAVRHVVAALAGDELAAAAGRAGQQLPDELTPREAEVLGLIAAGRTNAENGLATSTRER